MWRVESRFARAVSYAAISAGSPDRSRDRNRRLRLADSRPADIALVGGETLPGREIVEVFGQSSLGDRLRLVAEADLSGYTEDETDAQMRSPLVRVKIIAPIRPVRRWWRIPRLRPSR